MYVGEKMPGTPGIHLIAIHVLLFSGSSLTIFDTMSSTDEISHYDDISSFEGKKYIAGDMSHC